jgi:hypothetical protein
MAGRRITGEIEWAAKATRPGVFGTSHPHGAKLKGLQYERAVAGALPADWLHGQWFKFCDEGGVGYCQPDFIRVTATMVFVLECKLTDVMEAKGQLLGLYLPVLRHVFGRPVRGIVVARTLTPESTNVVASLGEAENAAASLPTLHWPWPPRPRKERWSLLGGSMLGGSALGGSVNKMNVAPAKTRSGS